MVVFRAVPGTQQALCTHKLLLVLLVVPRSHGCLGAILNSDFQGRLVGGFPHSLPHSGCGLPISAGLQAIGSGSVIRSAQIESKHLATFRAI